jgi:hypothetical protein
MAPVSLPRRHEPRPRSRPPRIAWRGSLCRRQASEKTERGPGAPERPTGPLAISDRHPGSRSQRDQYPAGRRVMQVPLQFAPSDQVNRACRHLSAADMRRLVPHARAAALGAPDPQVPVAARASARRPGHDDQPGGPRMPARPGERVVPRGRPSPAPGALPDAGLGDLPHKLAAGISSPVASLRKSSNAARYYIALFAASGLDARSRRR